MPKQDSPCLFCGGLPCVCDGGKKPKSSTRTPKAPSPKPTASPGPSSPPSVSATEAEFVDSPADTPKFKFKSSSQPDRDLSFESAIRVLRPLLAESERRQIDLELDPHPSPDVVRRLAEWRK